MMKALKVPTVQEIIRLADARFTPEGALLDRLNGLPRGQMVELMALMWLGRIHPDENRYEYSQLVEHATEVLGDLEDAAYDIAAKTPWLADYLRAGLAALRRSDSPVATGHNW